MAELNELQKQFGIARIVRFEAGRGGLPKVAVSTQHASAEIYLQGAQVCHFQPRDAAPVLFMSKSSRFEAGKALRGGVPLIFPWFGARPNHPESPPHGFARLNEWKVESCDARADGSVRLVFAFKSDEKTLSQWPKPFELRYIVIVSQDLDMTLETRNLSKEPMEFEDALHTYLQVGDSRQISVRGLESVEYIDKVDHSTKKARSNASIQISGETDRVYLNTSGSCIVHDPFLKRDITIEKEGSNATVVWNPWIDKSRAMPDFGNDEWQQMVCVETANVMSCSLRLTGGAVHRTRTRVSISA